MEYLEINREQILITIGLTAIFLWSIVALGIWGFRLPIMPIQLDYCHALIGLGLGLSISGISLLFHRSVNLFRESVDINMTGIVAPLKYQDLIWLGILPGVSEELLFRGLLLPTIGLNWVGITLSSVIFGILHLSQPRYYLYALWAMVVGVILALTTIVTHNLLTAVVAHITTNTLSAWLWKSHFHQT